MGTEDSMGTADRTLQGMDASVEAKVEQFQAAMRRFESHRAYRVFGLAIATVNVGCQAWLAWKATLSPPGWAAGILLALAAFVATDFVNGMVHLWMDHNEDYTGPAGPLVAQFHLHHRTPRYRRRPLAAVYFLESGSKIWLAAVLVAAVLLESHLSPSLLWFFAWFGILSSVAEVSHYLCHSSGSRLVTRLGRMRILLARDHMKIHHRHDNQGYCFLNGMCDPVVDRIARRFYGGYKEGTDRHYQHYEPPPATGSVRSR